MLQLSESVCLTERTGNSGKYFSGWIQTSKLRDLLDVADKAGLQAIGFSDMKTLKSKKTGNPIKIQTLTPFKLSPKSA